jgi:hypothetical protein
MDQFTPAIDLIYDKDCPNVQEARSLLRDALTEVGMPPEWREWDREGVETPPELRGLGSPTILVDGVDVSAGGAAAGAHSRSIARCGLVYAGVCATVEAQRWCAEA